MSPNCFIILIQCFLLINAKITIKQTSNPSIKCIYQVIMSNFKTKVVTIISLPNTDINWILTTVSEKQEKSLKVLNLNFEHPDQNKKERIDNILIVSECSDNYLRAVRFLKSLMIISVNAKVLILLPDNCLMPEAGIIGNVLKILQPSRILVLYDCRLFWARPFDKNKMIHYSKNYTIDNSWPKDFLGYTLKIAADPQPPYVMSPNKNLIFTDGVEVEIMWMIAKFLNFRLEFMGSPAGEIARILRGPNGITVGLFGLLDRLEADVSLSGIKSDPERAKVAEMLATHTVDSTVWVIPSAPPSNHWDALYQPFSNIIWLFIILSLLFATITTILYTQHQTTQSSAGIIFYITSGLLDQGFHINLQHPMFKLFTATFLIFCLIITNAYRSCLVTELTAKPKSKWFNTPEEVVAAGYKTLLVPAIKSSYEAARDEPLFNAILKPGRFKYESNLTKVLNEITSERKAMHLCVNFHCRLFIINNYLNMYDEPMAWILRKRYRSFMVTMFASPGLPLLPLFNRAILHIVAAGLNYYWLEQMLFKAVLKTTYRNYHLRLKKQSFDGPVRLSLNHLVSLFIVFAFCIGLSCVVFVLELCIVKKPHFNTVSM